MATVYLARKNKNILVTFPPMLFMLGMTIYAMLLNLKKFYVNGNTLLTGLSLVIFILTAWLLIGAVEVLKSTGQKSG